MPPEQRLPISAIVVSCDEGALLGRLLPTLSFCDEVVVVDLESTDDTVAVAEAHGARVLQRPRVASVERARTGVAELARNDWLLFTDPDEELPAALAAQIAELLPALPADVALVWAPILYRFRDRPLRGTVWGGVRNRRLLVQRQHTNIAPMIYAGTWLDKGFISTAIPFDGSNAIAHRWVTGYRDFLAKHRRYIAVTADDRAANGEVIGVRTIVTTPWRAFVESFARKRGYLDGPRGLALSLLWAWYSTRTEIALLRRLRADHLE
jgi:glycosyltransferase involved in cell wall biosynthesis